MDLLDYLRFEDRRIDWAAYWLMETQIKLSSLKEFSEIIKQLTKIQEELWLNKRDDGKTTRSKSKNL